jgi:hypothetical protein
MTTQPRRDRDPARPLRVTVASLGNRVPVAEASEDRARVLARRQSLELGTASLDVRAGLTARSTLSGSSGCWRAAR